MKNSSRAWALIGAIAFSTSSIAYAGYRSPAPVYVYGSGAYGSLADARASSDGTQYIGCDTYVSSYGVWTDCSATDAAGHSLYCWSDDPKISTIAAGISGDAWVYFTTDGSSSRCTRVEVRHFSYFSPLWF